MAPEFSIRSDSVDVEQIMKQIRSRIREKRGIDYTEEEIRELAGVKLEKFLDPAKLRSDLLDHYRHRRQTPVAAPIEVPPAPLNYAFEAETPYESTRGVAGWLLLKIRHALTPILKLFINPGPIVQVLNMQSRINTETSARLDHVVQHLNSQWLERENLRRDMDALNYEVAHNLVLEMTRLSMDVKNMKMRVESISSRLDFAERRARALEGVVQYRPGTGSAAEVARTVSPAPVRVAPARVAPTPSVGVEPESGASAKGEAQRRRRRRRRGRGGSGGGQQGQPGSVPVSEAQADDRQDAQHDLFADDRGADGVREAAAPAPETPAPSDTSRDPEPTS
jgi:hypothetical protein